LYHSGVFASTPAPATAISIAFHLDNDIHILFAKVFHCPLTDILEVRATRSNHVNDSEDLLVLVFMRMVMVVIVPVVMTVAMIMSMAVAVVVMAMAMAVVLAVTMITAAMARIIMSMVMT
jgi:hypothetical protein